MSELVLEGSKEGSLEHGLGDHLEGDLEGDLLEGDRSWQASLSLRLARGGNGTRLSRVRHNGPLYVQKPFYPEGREHAHVYLLHPPGGIVSGDQLNITVEVVGEAGALVTTPGAARIYRARDEQPLQQQNIRLRVSEQSILEWFPLETIVFNGACVELDTHINIDQGSRFAGWEINCFGLPARGELFERGSFRQHYRVDKDGVPIYIDRLQLSEDNIDSVLNGVAGMQHYAVSGFFLIGPVDDKAMTLTLTSAQCLDQLREQIAAAQQNQYAAISRVGDLFVGRYLGPSAEQARKLFTRWWQVLRPQVMQREACEPRIWST